MIMRRDVLKLMGAGLSAAALPDSGSAASRFPKGAIIRTVLKDLRPEVLTSGAVLFHEHMSLAADFMPKWIALARSLPPPAAPTAASRRTGAGAANLAGGRAAGDGGQGSGRAQTAPSRGP